MANPKGSTGYLDRPSPSGLADVIDVILDKGLVIDAYIRVSLIGIELLTIDARIVIASVDTYLRFAEAVNRLDLHGDGQRPRASPDLLEGMGERGAQLQDQGRDRGREGEAARQRRRRRQRGQEAHPLTAHARARAAARVTFE